MIAGFVWVSYEYNVDGREIFFNALQMKWVADYQSFVTTSKKLDLASLLGIPINKQTSGFVEFKMPSNEDDRVYIYLKSSNDNFYFFGYQKGVLNITSNNARMEEEFNKLKKKEKEKKLDNGEVIEFQWVDPSTAEAFSRRVQAGQK